MKLLSRESDVMKDKKKFKLRHLILILVVVYFCSIYYSQLKMIDSLDTEVVSMEKQISTLEVQRDEKIERLEKTKQYMSSEEGVSNSLEARMYIENLARNEGVVRENEIIFIDQDKKNDEVRKKFYNNSVK